MSIDLSSISDHEEEDDDCIIIYSSELKKRNTCMKQENKKQEKKVKNYDQDCMILDYDPFQSIVISHVHKDGEDQDEDISILSESGLVVCRDFPHSRHLCAKFPFDTSPHHNHCAQCYCYVCDTAAPCEFWHEISGGHCHASEKNQGWYLKRIDARKTSTYA